MKKSPYIEPAIRTIAGGFLLICTYFALYHPELKVYWLGFLFFIAINLFQSGLTRFCLMERILKKAGFRSEMDEIRSLALHDTLTELPNRALLENQIEMAIAQAQRNAKKVALLFIDLDNFKRINDIQGHKTGDQLLVALSQILQAKLRPYDTLARWGGDEFVVVVPDLTEARQARIVGEKLMEAVDANLGHEQNLHVSLSIGVAVYPDDADTTEALLIQADKALFYAKSQGRNNIQVFNQMQKNTLGYLDTEITACFNAAIKNNQLQVYYQPIVDAVSHTPVSVEALARWHDEVHGWISPGIFIPLAENMGLIEDLGKQVLEKSLAHYSDCPSKGQLRLAINVSNRQLFSKTFLPSIIDLLTAYDVAPEHLKLEITESSALETDSALHTLRTLADAGFYMSLDDFGTGFSSLSRLHELPFNELKIDMSFVRRIKHKQGRIMLKTIVDMGKAMQLAIVAEGVEDEETAIALRDMGVDYLQGYYFSTPKPYHECSLFSRGSLIAPDAALEMEPVLSTGTALK
jgi:diguanylate cyclase (GGDEF)-like protein